MRTLSASALEKLQARFGTEPVVIVEIQWLQEGGWSMYADRDIETSVKGKVLELGSMDDVVGVSENNDSQELSIVLDDTDGSMKYIIDNHDIHKRDVRVWQWFDGLALADRFLLFSGKINSPIEWSEGDQTLSFDIVSQLEDKEFGFSPEEGDLDFIPDNLIGQTWPSIFGTPRDVPVVRIGEAVLGSTLAGLGITTGTGDPGDGGAGVAALNVLAGQDMGRKQAEHLSKVASAWFTINNDTWEQYSDQEAAIRAALNTALGDALASAGANLAAAEDQVANSLTGGLGANPVRILGGEYFSRGVITLQIGGGQFTGRFGYDDDDNLFTIDSRYHPDDAEAYAAEIEAATQDVTVPVPGGAFDYSNKVPYGEGDWGDRDKIRTEGFFVGGNIGATSKSPVMAKYSWMDAGSRVTLVGNEEITYIVSIVPGTIKSVKTFKSFNGVKHFIDVPTNMYTISTVTYGDIQTVQITLDKTLSTLDDSGWDDDLYVTFESSVGPNIVEVLEYIIDLYTDFNIDSTSFDHVSDLLEDTPSHFAVLDRKNVLTILQEIAFQACCNLRLINGTFYLTYLPEAPTAVDTITETDIEFNSLSISTTATEDLVTKMVVSWRETYAKEPNTMILRYNVKKYGVQEGDYDFYIYNIDTLVQKAATFWLIRKGNTWKNCKFKTFMQKLNLESFDCVNLAFKTPYVANTTTKAIITSATVDTGEYSIEMECWLPVKSGEMERYEFSWLTDVAVSNHFPTNDEVAWGYAGGGGIGVDAEGVLPPAPKEGGTSHKGSSSSSGTRPNIDTDKEKKKGTNSGNSDRGNPQPADRGLSSDDQDAYNRATDYQAQKKLDNIFDDTKPLAPVQLPTVIPPNADGKISPVPTQLTGEGDIIDLRYSKVMDSSVSLTETTELRDILAFNLDRLKLAIKTDALFTDDTNTEEFHFKFDADGEGDGKWAAGTAYLKPDGG